MSLNGINKEQALKAIKKKGCNAYRLGTKWYLTTKPRSHLPKRINNKINEWVDRPQPTTHIRHPERQ